MGGDDRVGLIGADGVAEMIGIIGGVGEDMLSGQSVDEGMGLGDVVALPTGEDETHRQAQTAHGHMDLAGQAAARAANGLILSPPFAPAACWCARTMVESMIRYSKSGSSARAAKMRCHTPLWLQRSKRRHTLFQLPNATGRSRHGEPVRAIHRTPSTNMRLFSPVPPGSLSFPTQSGSIRAHCSSSNTNRTAVPKTASLESAVLN